MLKIKWFSTKWSKGFIQVGVKVNCSKYKANKQRLTHVKRKIYTLSLVNNENKKEKK